jgi:hypothetical protein
MTRDEALVRICAGILANPNVFPNALPSRWLPTPGRDLHMESAS